MAISRYPRRTQTRSRYARTSGDFLTNDWHTNPADGPPVWWLGVDSGGGADPIGPHGPWQHHYGRALPVVTRATALITGPLTAAPFTVSNAAQPFRDVTGPRWLTDPMMLRPDDRIGSIWPTVQRLARSVFWAEWVRSAIWWGEGAFIHREDEQGRPIAGSLRMADSRTLSTERDDYGALVWVIDDPRGDSTSLPAVFDRNGYLQLGPVTYRITVLRNPHSPVDSEGRSAGVFEMHPSTFRLGKQIETYTSGTFRSGVPAGYLKVNSPDMSQEKATKLKSDWLAAHGGDRRSIAVLNAVTDFVPVNLSPVDAELAEVARLNVADVAYAFGLDPMTLGVSQTGSMTYTNIRDAWLNHRDFGLAPWVAGVQDTLTSLVPAGQTITPDLDGFANPTRAERYAALKTGVDSGIITVDEAREMEGLPPMEAQPIPVQQPAQLVPTGDDQEVDQGEEQTDE